MANAKKGGILPMPLVEYPLAKEKSKQSDGFLREKLDKLNLYSKFITLFKERESKQLNNGPSKKSEQLNDYTLKNLNALNPNSKFTTLFQNESYLIIEEVPNIKKNII